MSRSVELTLAASALALIASLAYATVPAAAEPTATPGGPTITRPTPMPQPHTFPVLDLVPQTFELRAVSETADGSSLTETSSSEVDVTLSSDVLFAKDRAEIRPEAATALAEISAELDRRPPGRVNITGYTDDLGPEEYGYQLSERRAAAVRDKLGPALARHQVTIEGKGEEDPAYPNDSEANRAKNRRVVIHWARA